MKIYAHRGYSQKFPEGTKTAYLEAVKAGAVGGPRAPAEVEHRTHEEETKRVADNMEAIGKLREFLRAAILRDDAGAWDYCERLLLGASQKGCGVRYEFPSAP